MNETMQSILARRSYKAFESRAIDKAILDDILLAGQYAPCGMNQQSYHFTVLESESAKDLLKEGIRSFIASLPAGTKFPPTPAGVTVLPEDTFRGAPLAIIVSGNDAVMTAHDDCALAMENMFIAAASHGVMSGWSHMTVQNVLKDAALLKKLRIPEGYTVYAAAFFGYPMGQAKDRGARKENITIL